MLFDRFKHLSTKSMLSQGECVGYVTNQLFNMNISNKGY
jgi:hypothetical protein